MTQRNPWITNREKRSRTAETFTRALLAGTCLAAAGGAASAGTLIEGVNSGDFGNTLAGATVTDASTTLVEGGVNSGSADPNDYVKFASLLPGSSFDLTYSGEAGGTELAYEVLNSGGGLIHLFNPTGFGQTYSGVVPGDGIFVLHGEADSGFIGYSVTVAATPAAATPEPATLALTGIGIAGALAWRRKRNA